MRPNFWEKLDEFPPITCRLLARTKTERGGVRAMTVKEIASAAHMSIAEVNSLSWLMAWDDVPLSKIRAFTEACGIFLSDRASLRMHSAYIRRGAAFKYLKKSPEWTTVYKPMILSYVAARTVTGNSS